MQKNVVNGQNADAVKNGEISFSIATKDGRNALLTKRIKLINGQLIKDATQCRMSSGKAETVTLTPEAFGPWLQKLKNNQALVHGVSKYDKARIVSVKRLKTKPGETPQIEKDLPVISRTKDFFHYPTGPGLLMLDHDKARDNAVSLHNKALQAYTPADLISIITLFFPEIAKAVWVASCSTSSCIYDSNTGKKLRGKSAGFHLYLFPCNASDIPRFLKVLGQRLVLAEYGRIEFSRSGAVLERTPVDLLVGSPERLDFVAGAVCGPGLEQRLPAPEYQPGELLDTEQLLDLNSAEEQEYQAIFRQLKEQASPDQQQIKGEYLEQEAEKLNKASGGKVDLEQAREVVKARQQHVLVDEDLLSFAQLKKPVTVAHALDNGPAFDKKPCADPLEPEYDGGSKSKARFYWNNGKNPIIHSFAHGGIKYRFKRFGGEEQIDYDTVIQELIERTKTDCGAPFEKDALKMLARLKKEDKSRFMRVRQQIKAANHDVILKELDKDICASSRKGNSYKSSSSSSGNSSSGSDYSGDTFEERLLRIKGALVKTNKKGEPKGIASQSDATALLAGVLQGLYAYSSKTLRWYKFDKCLWQECIAGEFDKALTALLFSATDGIGFSDFYQNAVGNQLWKNDKNPLPEPPSGMIPFQNGLLDQASLELLPVTPDNANTWFLPFDYSPDAACQNFLEWLTLALDNDQDSVKLIQAWFNALLTGRPDLQVFLHLIGPAGTGKSTLGRLAFLLVGAASATTTTLKELETNRFETANICGKRLTAIEEAGKYGGSVSVLKSMTGQDPLRLERKNQQQGGSFIYEGQTLMMSNERMATTDYTSGIERRRITVEFSKRIAKEERAAWEKRGGEAAILHNEAAGIINWALRLSRDEVTDIFKAMPERVRRANLEAAIFNNPILEWMFDNLIPAPDVAVQVGVKQKYMLEGAVCYVGADSLLYPNYLTWCDENSRKCVTPNRFSSSLIDAAQTQGVKVEKKRQRDGTKILGMRIRKEGEYSWQEELEAEAVNGAPLNANTSTQDSEQVEVEF